MVNGASPIEYLGLKPRTYNALKRANINTIGDLMDLSDDDLINISQIGVYSLNDLKSAMEKFKEGNAENEFDPGTDCVLYYVDKRAMYEDNIIRFKNWDGEIVANIAVEDTLLSVRVKKYLHKAGFYTLLQIINANIHLLCPCNTASGFFDEIVKYLKEVTVIQYMNNCSARNTINTDAFAQILYNDINSTYQKMLLYSEVRNRVSECESIVKTYTKEDMYDKNLMTVIYDCPAFINAIGNIMVQIVASQPSGIDMESIKIKLPKSFMSIGKSELELIEMLRKYNIEYFNGKYMYSYHSIFEYIDTLKSERHKSIVLDRLKGFTLDRIARKHGITRERVRQIANKVLYNRAPVYEDRYLYWFEKYHFTKSDFLKIFQTNEKVYAYLNVITSKGKLPIKDILIDKLASDDMIKNVSML